MLDLYAYAGCGTCKKAKKWLDARGIAYREIPIREQPPSPAELERMLGIVDGQLKRLFNTAGRDYREQNIKERLPAWSKDEAIAALAANGNLIKRPFVLWSGGGLVGFREADWEAALGDA